MAGKGGYEMVMEKMENGEEAKKRLTMVVDFYVIAESYPLEVKEIRDNEFYCANAEIVNTTDAIIEFVILCFRDMK